MAADIPATADICDAHDDAVVLTERYRSLGGRSAMTGTAVTLKVFEDNSLVRDAVAEHGSGMVLVVDGGGSLRRSLVGGNVAAEAAANDWAGILVHGAVRDTDELRTTDLAVHALGTCPRKTDKRGVGERDVAVTFAGATIRPGDRIYADLDGVVVVPVPRTSAS
jgi:regulator of ribonuclease activity A